MVVAAPPGREKRQEGKKRGKKRNRHPSTYTRTHHRSPLCLTNYYSADTQARTHSEADTKREKKYGMDEVGSEGKVRLITEEETTLLGFKIGRDEGSGVEGVKSERGRECTS